MIDCQNQSTINVFQCIVDLLEKAEWNQTNKNESSQIGYQIQELISGNPMSSHRMAPIPLWNLGES